VDLSPLVGTSRFPALDEEISFALARLEAECNGTGGSLKWMGVVAPWVHDDPYIDYGHAIEAFSREELARFVSLGDDPDDVDLEAPRRFGDETDHPLNRAQMLYLKYRHGVYFPWAVCFHLLTDERWEDKHSGEGKSFAEAALREMPKTVAFVKSLPFREIGRCVLFGLDANDHAPAHRDSEPGVALGVAQSISFAPRRGKRFYLCDPQDEKHTIVDAPIYWFNDMDYHGVEPDPFFRYSIRVDGVLEPAFVREVEALARKR
jgi:Rieske 2Fe-2S family protein